MTVRRLDRFATDRWIDKLSIPRACKALLRCLVSKVDTGTGASHPRFPILQAAIAMAISYSIAHVCRAFVELEKLGYVIRRAMRARLTKGRIAQLPTDYQLVLPDECWREIVPVESTPAARVHEPQPAPAAHDWTLSVQGRLSERNAAPKVAIARWKLDPSNDHTFIDGMHFEQLAPKIFDAAKLAAENVPDELRTRVMTCLHELRARAREVALLACNVSIASWDAVNAVRAWVRKTLANPAQRVDTAEHALNILAKFVREQAETLYSRERAEKRRRERDKEQRKPREMTYSEVLAEYHQRGAHESSAAPPDDYGHEDSETSF